MIPGPEKALKLAGRRTKSPAVGAIQLLSINPTIVGAAAGLLLLVAFAVGRIGVVVLAVLSIPLGVVLARWEYSVLLVRTADQQYEMVKVNPITSRLTVTTVQRSDIRLPDHPMLGFRTLVVEGRKYKVRPNFDGASLSTD